MLVLVFFGAVVRRGNGVPLIDLPSRLALRRGRTEGVPREL